MKLEEIGKKAKKASVTLAKLGAEEKRTALLDCSDALIKASAEILKANEKDLAKGREKGMTEALLDRLALNEDRIKGIAEGLSQVADLEDPIGEVEEMKKRPNGLLIGKKTVPLGVVGMIYEARPNVTADAFGLCFKTGNAVILKGGSDAIESNKAIVKALKESLKKSGITEDALQLIEDTDRAVTKEFMGMTDYLDVLIPRGGAGLIKSVVEESKVPVIETGTGNCHVFVDSFADLNMAVSIIENAKTQRLGTCNTCESLVVHEEIAEAALPRIAEMLLSHGVEMRCDDETLRILGEAERFENEILENAEDTEAFENGLIKKASYEDWSTEYLDKIVSVKIVKDIDAAIAHINEFNTGHSEAIVTSNYDNAMKFLNEVDAAAVYVNASTRFTDGFEFGFGAEIGISTQKIHARGPMGLKALTSYKYIVFGEGQVRP